MAHAQESSSGDEDVAIMERLRAKYGGRSDVGAIEADQDCSTGGDSGMLVQQAAIVTEQAGASPLAGADIAGHVRVCSICNGSGRRQETYNYRVLESLCDHCQGEGVLHLGGPTTAAASVEQQCTVPPHRGAAAAVAQDDPEKRARVAAHLEARLQSYRQELAAVQARLSSGDGGAEQQAAARQLGDALEREMERLGRWLAPQATTAS